MSVDSIYGGGNIEDYKAAQQAKITQAATQANEQKQAAPPADQASQGAAQGLGQAQGAQATEYPKL